MARAPAQFAIGEGRLLQRAEANDDQSGKIELRL
jgi:hypothetical protein